ncbi:MAG: hypothetical protein ACI4WG_01290 [Erysipelotrichaceae bacterium]
MKEKNRKLKKAVIATTAATSILVNQGYDSPFEIIDDTDSDDSINQYEEKKKSPFKSKYKLLMSKIPQPVRAIVLFPLWYLGWLLMAVIEPLYSALIAPHISTIAYWLILLGLMLLVIMVASIFIFPALPLSKSINKKTISLSAFLILVLAIFDKLLSFYNPNYLRYSQIVKFSSICLFMVAILIYIYLKNKKVRVVMSNNKYQFHN